MVFLRSNLRSRPPLPPTLVVLSGRPIVGVYFSSVNHLICFHGIVRLLGICVAFIVLCHIIYWTGQMSIIFYPILSPRVVAGDTACQCTQSTPNCSTNNFCRMCCNFYYNNSSVQSLISPTIVYQGLEQTSCSSPRIRVRSGGSSTFVRTSTDIQPGSRELDPPLGGICV